MDFLYSGVSRQNQRSTNQDSFIIRRFSLLGHPTLFAAVCDGVGSLQQGGVAGVIAVDHFKAWIERDLIALTADATTLDHLGHYLCRAVEDINEKVNLSMRQGGAETAATLSAVLLVEGRLHLVHLGDSRVYRCGPAGAQQLTPDHTLQGEGLGEGGALTRYLGLAGPPEPYYAKGSLDAGEFLLLCSDGLYRRMDFEALAQTLAGVTNQKTADRAAEKLIDGVVAQGETDNITLLMIKLLDKR